MNASTMKAVLELSNGMGRPFLTALVTTVYNITLLVALSLGKLEINAYIASVGPTNAMIIGFWFGERSAARRAEQGRGEGDAG